MFWKKALLCLVMITLVAGSAVWAGGFEKFSGLDEVWEAAYNSGDTAAVAAMYLKDGMRMPPDVPIVKGRDAIQAQIQGGMDSGLAKVEIKSVELHEMGIMGFQRGTFKAMDAEGNILGQGKWANVSKKVDGNWHIYYDIWNFDTPRPAAE